MPKTAVIYARFSCNKLRVCRDWCKREGYAIAAEYCDYAISGRTDDRPEFQRMIANAGESDIVLVYMMDRFSRGEYDAPIYKRELAKKGVKLVSALEAIPDSPEGIIYVFPAHAGMIPNRALAEDSIEGVPRTRGDDPAECALNDCREMCSPHTRG